MNSPSFPILVIEELDVSVYDSIRDVQLDLEAIDVQTGGLKAYDADGRLLRLGITGGQATIALAENEPHHSVELESALRRFLEASRDPVTDDSTCDLKCLVDACRKYSSVTPTVGGLLKKAWSKLSDE